MKKAVNQIYNTKLCWLYFVLTHLDSFTKEHVPYPRSRIENKLLLVKCLIKILDYFSLY